MDTLQAHHVDERLVRSRNIIAAISSIIPGLGHLYKANYTTGIGLLILSPFILFTGFFVGFATAGFGAVIPAFYIAIVAWHAYNSDDKRHHLAGIF